MISVHAAFRQTDGRGAHLTPAEREQVAARLRTVPGLAVASLFTPATTSDPYLDDGPPPPLALQLQYPDIPALDAAGLPDFLGACAALPSLADAELVHEATRTRTFQVPEPRRHGPPRAPTCSYLVAYDGTADDPQAWVAHYVAFHVPIMARLPGIRGIEVDTPLAWDGALPGRRVAHLLRNKVAFDDAAALAAALNSPIRHEMRADYARFPAFKGATTHYPVATWTVVPSG
jgi:uncharacterized protein (TIGR02118 family)